MISEILKSGDHEVVFQMTFSAQTFEDALIHAYREKRVEDIKKGDLMLLSTAALLERCPDALEIVRAAVQKLLHENYKDAIRQLGITPVSDVEVQPVSGELDEPLVLIATVRVAPRFEELKIEGLEASYDEVYLTGTEVDDKLSYARAHYGVDSDEALLEKVETYDSVNVMRHSIAESMTTYVKELNKIVKRRAATTALLEANPITIPEAEIDKYVLSEIGKLKSQVGEKAFKDQIDKETDGIESLKKAVRRDVGYMPQLNTILTVIAGKMQFDVSDGDRREEISRQREQSIKPELMEPVEDTFDALKENIEMKDALDMQVKNRKALDYVVEKTIFKSKVGLSLREAAPQYFRSV